VRRRGGVISLVLLLAVSSLVLAGCGRDDPWEGTKKAKLWLDITPSVIYYNEPTTMRFSLQELGAVAVNLNYYRHQLYWRDGKEEDYTLTGETGARKFLVLFGTCYLPEFGVLEATFLGVVYDESEGLVREIITMGGTDTKGNFVKDSDEFSVLSRQEANAPLVGEGFSPKAG